MGGLTQESGNWDRPGARSDALDAHRQKTMLMTWYQEIATLCRQLSQPHHICAPQYLTGPKDGQTAPESCSRRNCSANRAIGYGCGAIQGYATLFIRGPTNKADNNGTRWGGLG